MYAQVFETGRKLLKEALNALGFVEKGEGRDLVLNTLPWPRRSLVQMHPIIPIYAPGMTDCPSGMSSFGFFECKDEYSATIKETDPGIFLLSNARYNVKVSAGAITSLYDIHEGRELIPDGAKANQLVLYDDKPLYWQAWDVEIYHLRSRTELHGGKSTISEDGPARVSVGTEYQISEHSWIRTTISLDAVASPNSPSSSTTQSFTSPPVTITAEVEWHETMKFLKVEFPTTIHSTEATYETQYGLVRRPTHYNTSWDAAKFEVCCHRFADLSDAAYGLTVLNDCKYGFATAGSTMRLSLLRAPKAPDAHADMGRHEMRWGLLPHVGPVGQESVRAGLEFNYPVRVERFGGTQEEEKNVAALLGSLGVESRSGGLVLDWVKRGEDDEDVSRREGLPVREGQSVVVRVYDALGAWTKGTLSWGRLPVRKVWRTNLLEDDERKEEINDGRIDIEVRAFEVVTWRLQL